MLPSLRNIAHPARLLPYAIASSSSSSTSRHLPLLFNRNDESQSSHPSTTSSFFDRQDRIQHQRYDQSRGRDDPNGKGKRPIREGVEEEVSDAEWELRAGSALLHLRATLPQIFHPPHDSPLYPPSIYSNEITLHLPEPLPLAVSSLPLYSTTFALARNGMKALHTDLHVSLDRLTVSDIPPPSSPTSSSSSPSSQSDTLGTISSPSGMLRRRMAAGMSKNRFKQIRVLLSVYGTPRLPPHKETSWQTSSLYTLSPLSGLILSHHVETIRPLPGQGVGEWLNERLGMWGWRAGESEGMMRPVGVRVQAERELGMGMARCARGDGGKKE